MKILADSASRAGQMHQAAQAYHKMGVILDNASQFKEAGCLGLPSTALDRRLLHGNTLLWGWTARHVICGGIMT